MSLAHSCINSTDIDVCFDNLRKSQINELTPYKVQEKLKKFKQKDYLLIEEYYTEARKLVQTLSIIYNYKKSEADKRLKEIFINGLHPSCQIDLAKANVFEINDIVAYITRIEDLLLLHAKGDHKTPTEKVYKKSEPLKYCSYHKSTFHSSSECRKYNELKNKRSSEYPRKPKDNDRNASTVILAKPERLFSLKAQIYDLETEVLLDTGATHSFLNLKVAKSLNLKLNDVQESRVSFANSSEHCVTQSCDVPLKFVNSADNSVQYDLQTYVIPELNCPIILGVDFIDKFVSVINLEKRIINLKNRNLIFLRNEDFNHQNIDNEIYEKSNFSITTKLSTENKFQKFLKSYETSQTNDKFANIKPVKINYNKSIKLTSKPYPVQQKHFYKFKEKIKQLLHDKIISHSTSHVTSPAFVADKPNGDIRIIVDYRELNEFIEDDSYYFPTIYDNIDRIAGMNFFSTIDLTNSFYQLRITDDSKFLTSFITPIGQFHFNTLPFGLKSSPKLFQRAISEILFDFNNIIIFMDDILIFDQNEESHLNSIILILNKLKEYCFTINLNKCIFFQRSIKYLGLEIDSEGYKANLNRLKTKIFELNVNTKKQIQRFVGYLNFFRPFLPKISIIIAPMNEILKTNNFNEDVMD